MTTDRPQQGKHGTTRPDTTGLGNRLLSWSEDVIYVGIAVLLVIGAIVLLVDAATQMFRVVEEGAAVAMLQVLDTLLLVFVVVELLFAVRATLVRRELVAEPFLLVGIIASIKEIVVLSVEAAGLLDEQTQFRNAILEIGVLGILVLSLSGAAVLLRAKEREPAEGERDYNADAQRHAGPFAESERA